MSTRRKPIVKPDATRLLLLAAAIVIGGVTRAVNDSGQLVLTGLPTTDPGMAGTPWLSSGAFSVRVDATAT
jgi:hypothetical protein